MNRFSLLTVFLLGVPSYASDGSKLTLQKYLEQVKAQNPEARAASQMVEALDLRQDEALTAVRPELYAQYSMLDDKKQTAQPAFMGDRTRVEDWRAGIRSQTTLGLGIDAYFDSARTNLDNVDPNFFPLNDYNESRAVLELKQSLWRNSFGAGTRADIDGKTSANRVELLKSKFALKTILLNAENAYWGVVSLSQTVKLQEDNVDRAGRLRDKMNKRTKMRLFDDVDALQAEAAFQTRELELETSRNQLAMLTRNFNSLRGVDADEIGAVEELPAGELLAIVNKKPPTKISREDFEMIRERANGALAQAAGAKSQLMPQLDLQASFASNGRNGYTSAADQDLEKGVHPTWSAQVLFSVPLDYTLIRDLKKSYRMTREAGQSQIEQASFQEGRFWDDLLKQKKEAQGRFERGVKLENLQTQLVKQERQRLSNGRATTFEALTFEQNLALTQIQRVKAQLDLLQIYNMVKTFEVKQ